ncbi:Zinc finger CCCH domain-containing protein 7, partial [Mucuna pruriens]
MDQHHFLHHHHYHHQQEHRTRYPSLAPQSHHHNLPPPPSLSFHRTIHTPPPQPYTPSTPQPQPQQQFPFTPPNTAYPHHHHRPLEEEPRPLYDLLPRRAALPWNPNPRTTLPDDFDREFHHHRPPPPPHPPIETLRYDPDRVVDPYDQNPRETLAWGAANYHAPGQADVDHNPGGGYVRVYSVECDADVASRGSRVESKRWLVSDRERGRELHLDSSSSSALVNGSNNDKYYHGSDMGSRYNRGNGRECGHEFARTPPKKQVQKKSALLRIQTVKPNNHRNREVEQLRYPGYANECSSSGFFRGKEQYLGHGAKGEEREGSPVELDISFESNSLVAKAIVAQPSSVSVPDLNVTPVSDLDLGFGEKSRRVSGSDGDCSGLQPVRVSSVIVDLNRSPCKGNDSSKEVNAQKKNVDDSSSQPRAGQDDDSRGKSVVPNLVKVGNVCSGKSTTRVVKKKKIVKRVVKKATANPKSSVSNSLPAKIPPGTMGAESVALSLSTVSGPEKIEANLDEKSNPIDEVAEPVCLHSLPKEGNVLKEDKEGALSLLSLGPDSRSQECKSDKDSDIGKVSRFERDGNISNSPSCASSSEDKKSDSDCLDANNSVCDNGNTISVHDNANISDCLDANNSVPNTDKFTKSLNASTISEVNHMDYDNKQLCQSEVSLSPGKYSNVGSSQNRNLVDVGDELFKSSDTLSSSGKTRIQDGLDCLQHTSALKHSSDNGSSNLEDSISVHCSGIMHDAGKQVSPSDVIISLENCKTEKVFPNFNISAGSGEGDTHTIRQKRKARTELNFLSSEMECLSSDHVNPVSLANNVDGGSSPLVKEPCPSEVLDQSVQSLDFNSQSGLDVVTALHGKGGVLQAQFYVGNIDNDDANEVSSTSKRSKVTGSHPNFTQCQSEFSAVIVATTSIAEAPISFSDNQEHQKEVALSSIGICIPSTARSMPYSEDITGGSFESINAKTEAMSSEYLKLEHSDIVSLSPCTDLAFPNAQFSLLVGECKENITPIVPISNTQTDVLAVGNIMGEKTDLQAVEENYQHRNFVQRSPRADMEPNDLNMKNDLLAPQNHMSCAPSGDEVTTSNSNDELIEDAPGASSDMFSEGMVSEVLNRRILESTAIHDENICADEENPDNGSLVERGSDLKTFTSSIQQTKKIIKSDHAIGHSNLITKKTMSEPFQVSSKVTTQALNSYHSELSGTKNQSGGVILKTFPGHSFTFSKSKTKISASSTHVSKPRTWHRTGNNPPTSLPKVKLSVGTVPPKRPIVESKGTFQNTSYVRKGNSLVRKPTPVSALPQISSVNQSSSLGLDEIPKSTKSESRADEIPKSIKSESGANVTDQPMNLRTGATNAPQQRQRTPPLPIDTKSEENTLSLVQPHGDCCENASDPRKFIETNDNAPNSSEDALKHYENPENQTGPSDNGESQVEANNGNIFSLNTKRIVYIKPKTNQLVATSNSCDVSLSADDNGQTVFSDGYYKRRKNQLVRTTFESHINQTVAMPNSTTNSDGQGTSNAHRRFSKKRSHKVARSSCKRSRASLVWTLCSKNSSENYRHSRHYQKVLPQLFPWKRTTFLRSFIHNSASSFNSSSLSVISKKLLQLRKRDTVYTRSTHGFSLWKSRVLGVGGCSLKWSKSIEKNSKQANEEATLAVAAVERKKREQKNAVCIGSQSKTVDCAGERIFRIGSVRYRMDPSRRTLQRISGDKDDESLPSASTRAGLDSKRAYIPRRLVIGNEEYVRIGNGNQLIRDPKKRTRKLANEKVRWSLHTARQRLARKQKYCQFFTRFGKCKKDGGKCPYIHDPSKIAVCTKFLNGLCSTPNCKLTHKVIPERMPDCSYFMQGLCSNSNCPYRHVNVNPKASICEGFLKGYCADGDECRKKHSYVCPTFEATGTCTQGSNCKLHHPIKQSKGKKRKRSGDQNNSRGRYFGSITCDVSESGMTVAPKRRKESDELEEELSDYVSLDVNEVEEDSVDQSFEQAAPLCDDDSLDLQLDDFDQLIKPILLMKTKFTSQSPQSTTLQA